MSDSPFHYIGQYDSAGHLKSPRSGFNVVGKIHDRQGINDFQISDMAIIDGLFLGVGSEAYLGAWTEGSNWFHVCLDASCGDRFVYGDAAPVGEGFPMTFAEFGQLVKQPVPLECLAAGTRIATPLGDCAIEDLSVGDEVLSADGRRVPVRWIGRISATGDGACGGKRPLRIRAGALGRNVPHIDLIVTPDQGIQVRDEIIPAAAMTNGTTIAPVPASEVTAALDYYHVEMACHEVIRANGAAIECYVDHAGLQMFDNKDQYPDLYGAEILVLDTRMLRVSSQRLVPGRRGHHHRGICAQTSFEYAKSTLSGTPRPWPCQEKGSGESGSGKVRIQHS